MIKKILVTIFFALCFSHAAAAQLTNEQQAAKNEGLALYQQSDWYDSQPLLQVAADAGDAKAQYYLGEAIRKSKRYTTDQAKKWYEAAANQGDLYAMLRLSKKDDLCSDMGTCTGKSAEEWRGQALKIAHERAKTGDTEAMTVLYTANQGVEWLEKAAEAGDSYAQNLLANFYKDGGGWFLVPGSRDKAVEKWFKASAEGGYPLGMALYANYLYEHGGNKADIRHWITMAAKAGHIDSFSTYAANMAEEPNDLGYSSNLVKAYGLTYLLSSLEGGGSIPKYSKEKLPSLANKMTADEIKLAMDYANEWKKTNPPLSYFDPIYGY